MVVAPNCGVVNSNKARHRSRAKKADGNDDEISAAAPDEISAAVARRRPVTTSARNTLLKMGHHCSRRYNGTTLA